MRTRGLSALLASGWLFALACCAAAAQVPTLQWSATVGFGGAYKEGAWAPVFVDISNQGDSQRGEVIVPIADTNRPGPARAAINYTIPVEAPRNSSKRYLLYVPPERLEKVYLRLGRTQLERELAGLRVADRSDSLVVVLGGEQGLLSFLDGGQAAPRAAFPTAREDPAGGMGGGQQSGPVIRVGRAEWDSLPESWLGWDGVNAVVLGEAGFAAASPEGMAALLAWVEQGGTLIVPGGALAPQMAASAIGGMLPTAVQGTATAAGLEALAAWAGKAIEPGPVLVAAGPLREGASVLCGSPQQPLITVRDHGAGRIAMTSFDYTAAPVKYWDGQTAMWQRLIAQAPGPPALSETAEQSSPYSSEISLADAASYTPAAALPPFWLLLGFLGAYIIVLVPVNYAVLKRWDRRELAWVTTPAIVIVFTLGAYAVGYGLRGGEIVLNRLAVVETAAGVAGPARGRGYVGIFSPGRTSYDLLLKGTAASARRLSSERESVRSAAVVSYGPELKVANIGMNMWTSRAFCVEFLADLKGGLDGSLEYDGKDVLIRLQNNTGHTLKRCRLIQATSQGKRKDIRPGESAEWTFSGGGGAIGDRDRYSGGPNPQWEIAEGMEELAMRSLFGGRGGGRGGPASVTGREPCLVAVIDEPMVPAELARRRPQTNDVNLLIARLPLRLASGRRIKVPKWMISGQPIAADGSVGMGDPWSPSLALQQGSVIFEFRAPVGEKGGAARSLVLSATAEGYPGSPGQPRMPPGLTVSAFNRRLNEWAQLPATFPTIRVPGAADYMTREGRVLVKMAAHGDSINLTELGLAGEIETF